MTAIDSTRLVFDLFVILGNNAIRSLGKNATGYNKFATKGLLDLERERKINNKKHIYNTFEAKLFET